MSRIFSNIALALAFTGLGFGSAYADTIDLGEIELGKAYEIPYLSTITGTITAPSTGTLYQYGGSSLSYVLDGQAQIVTSRGYGDNGQTWSIEVEEGLTYEVDGSWVSPGNDGTITWNMQGAEAFELKSINPEEYSSITAKVNGTGDIMVTFSEPWKYTNAYITCDGKTSASAYSISATATQGIRIGEWMEAFYTDGTFDSEGGTPFQLVIEGISNDANELYNTDGSLTITYYAAKKAIDLVDTNVVTGDYFLSYYYPGDEAGIFYFTFSGDLSTEKIPMLEIGAGNPELEGKYYFTELEGVIDGATVSFDLTGVNRAAAIARCEVVADDMVSVKLKNVWDSEGNLSEGAGSTNVGTYPFTLFYKVVEEQIVSYEFTPGNGSYLTNASTLNLWMMNTSSIASYDGILFEYYPNGLDEYSSELIPASDLVNISTEADQIEFDIPLPEKAKTAPVRVSLANVVSYDGYDKLIQATYNQLVVLWSSPFQEGKDCSMMPTGEQIRVRTNSKVSSGDGIVELYLKITNQSANHTEYAYQGILSREEGADGYFISEPMSEDVIFLADCVYQAYFDHGIDNGMPGYILTFYGATVSSIDSVLGTAPASYDVYRLNGSVVKLGADKAALSGLAPGFYIINGKAVYLK